MPIGSLMALSEAIGLFKILIGIPLDPRDNPKSQNPRLRALFDIRSRFPLAFSFNIDPLY